MKVKTIQAYYQGIETPSYLLISEKEAVLIDSGSTTIAEQSINPELKKLNRKHSFQLSAIVNTHSHADHSGGDRLMKSTWHSTVLIHQSESRYVSDRIRAVHEHFASPFYAPSSLEMKELKRDLGPSVKVDRQLRDGSKIEFGNCTLSVLHTPGHSKGSISLYEPEERLLFLGDSIQGSGVKADFRTLPIYDDVDAYVESLKRLRELNVTIAYLGHPFLPTRKTKLRPTEYRTFIDRSMKTLEQLGRTIEYAHDGQDAIEVSRKIMTESGWENVGLVPFFVLKSVEAFLRSRRFSQ
jgi:hydroxyacylglutathione hydrolase